MPLEELRAAIDQVDDRIVELLVDRCGLVQQIAAWKKSADQPLRAPQRESAIHERIAQRSTGTLSPKALESIFDSIFLACRETVQDI